MLPKIKEVEELHDLSFEEYADNFFEQLERSANDSEFFIRIGDKIYIKNLNEEATYFSSRHVL